MTITPTRPGFIFEAGPAPASSHAAPDRSPLALMGDALTFPAETSAGRPAFVLIAQAPRTRSLVRLYKDGRLVAAARGGRLEYAVRTPGVYRVEVFLYKHRVGSLCLGAKPWIFSNPIYVPARCPSRLSAQAAVGQGGKEAAQISAG